VIGLALTDALQGMQVDQDVGQSVVVGDGNPIAQFGALDAQVNRLAVDTCSAGARRQ
jgi:hypothetical protein